MASEPPRRRRPPARAASADDRSRERGTRRWPDPGRERTGERGQASVLGYVLMLTIAALLVSGLLIASGDLVEGERERAIRTELTVVGEQLAGDISTVDNLVQSSEAAPSRARVTHEFPADVTGSSYTVAVETSPARLVLRSADPEVRISISLATETPLSPTSLSGGPVRVVYTGGALEVRSV